MTDEEYGDVRRVISLSFRGQDRISDIDLERILSFDMEWLSPEEAEIAVSKLIEAGWLIGDSESLFPAFDVKNIATPIGWYPRPSRLLQPVEFKQVEDSDKVLNKTIITPSKIAAKAIQSISSEINDPREKLANRLKKYISGQTQISVDEIQRRSERKQKALNYASNWLCLALIAREQGLEMEQIVSSLSS